MELFKRLQATLESLFVTLQESSSKVETTARIGDDLYAVTEKLNGLMARFTFDRAHTIPRSPHEKRRFPRAEHSLLVHIVQDGMDQDGVSSDFSLSGMKLRYSAPLKEDSPVLLRIHTPQEDLDSYRNQAPLEIHPTLRWQRELDGKWQCGVDFDLDAAQKGRMQECFAYYHKNSHF